MYALRFSADRPALPGRRLTPESPRTDAGPKLPTRRRCGVRARPAATSVEGALSPEGAHAGHVQPPRWPRRRADRRDEARPRTCARPLPANSRQPRAPEVAQAAGDGRTHPGTHDPHVSHGPGCSVPVRPCWYLFPVMQQTRVETRTYTLADAAAVLGTSEARVLQLVDAGLPERGALLRRTGARALTFQDLVLLRNAKRLVDQAIAPARVADALRQARARLPSDRPMSALRLEAAGQQVVVREGPARVAADSGQVLLDLDVAPTAPPSPVETDALFSEAQSLEDRAPARARALYAELLARSPGHADAHVNLGRLLHEAGQLPAAQAHYRAALAARPGDATAAYNLAVSLGDQGRAADAVQWYETALRSDPQLAEAHYNLACLLERRGQPMLALRHLKEYRRLAG